MFLKGNDHNEFKISAKIRSSKNCSIFKSEPSLYSAVPDSRTAKTIVWTILNQIMVFQSKAGPFVRYEQFLNHLILPWTICLGQFALIWVFLQMTDKLLHFVELFKLLVRLLLGSLCVPKAHSVELSQLSYLPPIL